MTSEKFTTLDTAKFADEVGFKTAPNPMTWTMLHKICELAWGAGYESAKEEDAKICEQSDAYGEGPDCWDWHSKDYAKAIRESKP